MRTALLAALEHNEHGDLQALVPLAGRSVLGWQVDMARQLGCKRVVCITHAPSVQLLSIQHDVEASGGEFHALRNHMQLVALLNAEDDLVLVGDGLIADPTQVCDILLSDGRIQQAILHFPAHADDLHEPQFRGFERIDADRFWSGIAVMRGEHALELANFPADGDTHSLLLRLALQSHIPVREVPVLSGGDGQRPNLILAGCDNALSELEDSLIKQATPRLSWAGPSEKLAAGLVQHFAPRGLHRGAAVGLGAMAVVLAIGMILVWNGLVTLGLVCAALGAFAGMVSKGWIRLRERLYHQTSSGYFSNLINIIIDVLVVTTLLLALSPGMDQPALMALPFFTVGLFRLAGRDKQPAIAAFWSDRPIQLAILAGATVLGLLIPALIVSGLGALGAKMLREQV